MIGCLMGSTWIPKSKSNMLTPKTNLPTFQPEEVSREMGGVTFCVYSTSCVLRHILAAIEKFFLSNQRAPCDIGAMSRRGQDTTSSDGSPMAKARPTNLVLQGQCKEGVSSQGSGSPVNRVNEYNRKELAQPRETGVVLAHMPKLEVPKCIDKRWSSYARRLGHNDLTRPKSEEDSPSTGQTCSSITRNGKHGILQSPTHREDISMHTEETGKNFNKCYILIGFLQEQRIGMVNVHDIVRRK